MRAWVDGSVLRYRCCRSVCVRERGVDPTDTQLQHGHQRSPEHTAHSRRYGLQRRRSRQLHERQRMRQNSFLLRSFRVVVCSFVHVRQVANSCVCTCFLCVPRELGRIFLRRNCLELISFRWNVYHLPYVVFGEFLPSIKISLFEVF